MQKDGNTGLVYAAGEMPDPAVTKELMQRFNASFDESLVEPPRIPYTEDRELPAGFPHTTTKTNLPLPRLNIPECAPRYANKTNLCSVALLLLLSHGQKCLHLFSDSEAYHEQIGPIPSSNGCLDIALSIAHTWRPRLHADVWQNLLQVDTKQVCSYTSLNGENVQFFTSVSECSCHYWAMMEA